MAKQVVLKNTKFSETTFPDGSKQLVGIVRGDSFLKVELPTDPNPRQFIGEINSYYTEMVKTLKSQPELFSRKNSGGISIFASSCDSNGDGSYTIHFNEGDGIANGIHTYNALKRFGRENSCVKVSIDIGLQAKDKVDIAESLNLSRKLPFTTLQNKKGAYDWHKEFIGDKVSEVSYHEGDTGIIEVREELSFLNLFKFDPDTKKMDIMRNLSQSEVSNSAFIQKTVNKKSEQFEQRLKWISRDVHDMVMYAIHAEKFVDALKPMKKTSKQRWTKPRGTIKKDGLVKGLALLLIAGLAAETTLMNKNGITIWRPEFKTYESRTRFIDELFPKVTDIITVEEGNSSEIIRLDSVRKKVLRHAHLIRISMLDNEDQKKKLLTQVDALQSQFVASKS